MNNVDLRLNAIIGLQNANGRSLADMVLAAVQGGVTLIQYRDKELATRAMIEQARAIKAILAGSKVPLLINDRIDVALAAGADGVHIGQSDMSAQDARALLGPSAIIGLTINNTEHALEAPHLPIDYACIGSVFPTGNKTDAGDPIGLNGLSELRGQMRRQQPYLPVGAISGISRANAASVIAAGADGIAVISAVFGPTEITGAARDLRDVIDAALQQRA